MVTDPRIKSFESFWSPWLQIGVRPFNISRQECRLQTLTRNKSTLQILHSRELVEDKISSSAYFSKILPKRSAFFCGVKGVEASASVQNSWPKDLAKTSVMQGA